MPQVARIKLESTNLLDLEKVSSEIKELGIKTGVNVKGPVPLPTKKLRVVTRKAPSGQGTHTFDKWDLKLHRRLIDIDANERTMGQLTRLRIPESVSIEIKLRTK
ncbi:MAG: 30S ribosomal protein S10 [Nitrososphaerota archaeon]